MTASETLINKNLDQMGLFKKSQATFPWIFHKFTLCTFGITDDWISGDMIKLSKLNYENNNNNNNVNGEKL